MAETRITAESAHFQIRTLPLVAKRKSKSEKTTCWVLKFGDRNILITKSWLDGSYTES